jgi:hypothetical protein
MFWPSGGLFKTVARPTFHSRLSVRRWTWLALCALHCTALHYKVLDCTVHCTALHCSLHCTVHCTALNCTAQHCSLHCTALHCTALHCNVSTRISVNRDNRDFKLFAGGGEGTALHCTELHCTALHCTALHCTALHCTALHCTALHCTALHCTAPLHCISWELFLASRTPLIK